MTERELFSRKMEKKLKETRQVSFYLAFYFGFELRNWKRLFRKVSFENKHNWAIGLFLFGTYFLKIENSFCLIHVDFINI